jgi:cell division inhibitor SulA
MLTYQNMHYLKEQHQNCIPLNYWIDIVNSKHNTCDRDVFITICRQHSIDKRWVLVVDPQPIDIVALQHCSTITAQKILQVHSNKTPLTLANIQKTLQKGNCAAVILCNAQFKHQQLLKLNLAAQQGKTHCVVINR